MTRVPVAILVILVFAAQVLPVRAKPKTPPKPVLKKKSKQKISAAELLQQAQNAFNFQEYDKALNILVPLLTKRQWELSSRDELVARELLGACYWRAKKLALAQIEFTTLLVKNNAAKLNPFVHPTTLIDYFEKTRIDLIKRGLIKDMRKKPSKPTMLKEVWRYNYYALNFIPFGVGQFQNGQTFKGTMFAVFQGLMLLTNITSYLVIETRLINKRGLVTNPTTARALQITQYTAIGLFAGLAVWGIIDALVLYKPRVLIRRENVPLDRKKKRAPVRPVKSTRFFIVPSPVSRGATLQLGVTFQ